MSYNERLAELKKYIKLGIVVGAVLGLIPVGLILSVMKQTGEPLLPVLFPLLFMYLLSILEFGGIPYGWHVISKFMNGRFIIGSPFVMFCAFTLKLGASAFGSILLPIAYIHTKIKIKQNVGSYSVNQDMND